jgi:hypothetical protein
MSRKQARTIINILTFWLVLSIIGTIGLVVWTLTHL